MSTESNPFSHVSERKLKNLGARLQKLDDHSGMEHSREMEKVVGTVGTGAVCWHLVESGFVEAESNLGLIRILSGSPYLASDAAVVTDLVCRFPDALDALDDDSDVPAQLLDNYTIYHDQLLFYAYHNDRPNLLARADELSSPTRLGLAFIQRRCGEDISEEECRKIMRQLARYQCKNGLVPSGKFWILKGGEPFADHIGTLDKLRALATLFGTDEEWDAALVEFALRGDWKLSPQIADAIRVAPTGRLVELLFGGPDSELLGTGTLDMAVLDALEGRKGDDPDELLASVLDFMDSEEWPPEELCELLGLFTAVRYGQLEREPPEELDRLFNGEFVSGRTWRLRLAIEAYHALPRDRALAIARKGLERRRPYGEDILPLVAHFDQELFDTLLAKDNQFAVMNATFIGAFGERQLPLLLELYEEVDEYKKKDIAKGILVVISMMNDSPPEAVDRFITFGSGSHMFPEDIQLQSAALPRFPKERRNALVDNALDAEGARPLQILRVVEPSQHLDLIEKVLSALFQDWRFTQFEEMRDILDPLGDAGIALLEKVLPEANKKEDLFRYGNLEVAYDGEVLERLQAAAGQ